MGFERNYRIRIPSKQLINNFSTFNYPAGGAAGAGGAKLEPWFVTGFTDAEGSFSIILDKNNKRKLVPQGTRFSEEACSN
jgi:hypothetical protein